MSSRELQYTRYLREDLAADVRVSAVGAESGVIIGPRGVFAGDAVIKASPLGLRWNPLKGDHRSQSVKPYLAAGFGPVFGASDGSFSTAGSDFAGSRTQATVGGHIGAGVDFHVARAFSVGVNAGYNWMVDFAEPVGSRDNYSGPELGLSFGWLFGKGRTHYDARLTARRLLIIEKEEIYDANASCRWSCARLHSERADCADGRRAAGGAGAAAGNHTRRRPRSRGRLADSGRVGAAAGRASRR